MSVLLLKGGGGIGTNSCVNQSLEYFSRLMKDLENTAEIPKDKFEGETAAALRKAYVQQMELLKEIYSLMNCL